MKTSQALSVINRSSYIIRVQMLTLSLLFNMPKTIAIYGDSYVKRLREFCGGDLHVPGSIYWYDKSGLRADFKRRDGQPDTYAIARFNQMLDLRPDVAFINVCGNDITSKTEPSEIIDRVVKITSDLREAGTTTIFISEILTRGDFSKSQDTQLDKATFDRKRQKNQQQVCTMFHKRWRFSTQQYKANMDLRLSASAARRSGVNIPAYPAPLPQVKKPTCTSIMIYCNIPAGT